MFLRPRELAESKWEYVDFDKRLWRIPAHVMKQKRDHLVPIANQVYGYLKELYQFSGKTEYLFPRVQTNLKPMNCESLRKALRVMGFTK